MSKALDKRSAAPSYSGPPRTSRVRDRDGAVADIDESTIREKGVDLPQVDLKALTIPPEFHATPTTVVPTPDLHAPTIPPAARAAAAALAEPEQDSDADIIWLDEFDAEPIHNAGPALLVRPSEDDDPEECTVIELPSDPPAALHEVFFNIERYAELSGLQNVSRVDNVIRATPKTAGTVALIPFDQWRLDIRLKYFRKILGIARHFHDHGVAVGSFAPELIQVGHNMEPFVIGPNFADPNSPYTAPEIATGARPDMTSDIYALGKLLYFIIAKHTPPAELERIPKLKELFKYPAGLVRIVRKAVAFDRGVRYHSVQDFLRDLEQFGRHDEVGLAHQQVEEPNRTVYSLIPRHLAPEEEKRDSEFEAAIVDLYKDRSATYARIRRITATVVLVFGLSSLGATALRNNGDLQPVPETSLDRLPSEIISVSLSQDTPPAFFVTLNSTWDGLNKRERLKLARTIIDAANKRWQSPHGFIYRGNALVAHYWDERLDLLGAPPKPPQREGYE